MAKKTAMPTAPTSIEVRYDLHELPSAQHKAGLAGLLLQIENMRERQAAGQLPADLEIPKVEQTATTVVAHFTERSTQNLFDDLYAARGEERSSNSWDDKKKSQPLRVEVVELVDKRGKSTAKTTYYYIAAVPLNHFLNNFTQGEKQCWHKLWRDMIYDVPRKKFNSRIPYQQRAKSPPTPTKVGADAWKA